MKGFASKISLIFAFVLAFSSLPSQNFNAKAPGYLGKRNSISYGFYVLPALGLDGRYESRRSMKAGLFQTGGSLYFNTSHQVRLERVLSKVFTLALTYDYLLTADGYTNSMDYEHFLIDLKSPGILLKLFPFRRKGAIAPLGPYSAIGFQWGFAKMKFGEPKESNYMDLAYSSSAYTISTEFGLQKVIADILLFNAGLRYALTMTTSKEGPSYRQEILENRLFTQNLMKIHLGIGYLF